MDRYYPSECEITQGLRKMADLREACRARARKVRLVLLDVDGVLTDGTITYTQDGDEIKSFHTRDGLGIRLLREAGIEVGLITARGSRAITRRAADLALGLVFQNVKDKAQVFEAIREKVGCSNEEVAFMGDDWLDLGLLRRVGLAATVADAVAEVKEVAHFISSRPGGRGAVRELCDLVLDARGARAALLEKYGK